MAEHNDSDGELAKLAKKGVLGPAHQIDVENKGGYYGRTEDSNNPTTEHLKNELRALGKKIVTPSEW